jgi:hypothetical protein
LPGVPTNKTWSRRLQRRQNCLLFHRRQRNPFTCRGCFTRSLSSLTSTIRLLVEEVAKLQTKLRHVDIHSHWLRQEVQRRTVQLQWQETSNKMITDGLTKDLSKVRFKKFTEMVGLEDMTERHTLIRRQDELEDELQKIKSQEKPEIATFTYSRDLESLGYNP